MFLDENGFDERTLAESTLELGEQLASIPRHLFPRGTSNHAGWLTAHAVSGVYRYTEQYT